MLWIRDRPHGGGAKTPADVDSLQTENRQLRAECERLRTQRNILKNLGHPLGTRRRYEPSSKAAALTELPVSNTNYAPAASEFPAVNASPD